jgi:type IV pilus modification protein PilV
MRGFAMIEVLVALLVASLTLTAGLGLALRGLADIADSVHRQAAADLAADLAGRIGALSAAAWDGTAAGTACTAACLPGALAAAELGEWQAEVAARLPEGAGSLRAAAGGALEVVVAWTDRSDEAAELRLAVRP